MSKFEKYLTNLFVGAFGLVMFYMGFMTGRELEQSKAEIRENDAKWCEE